MNLDQEFVCVFFGSSFFGFHRERRGRDFFLWPPICKVFHPPYVGNTPVKTRRTGYEKSLRPGFLILYRVSALGHFSARW